MKKANYVIIQLIQRYVAGTIEKDEQQILMEWIEACHANRSFFDRIISSDGIVEREHFFQQIDKQERLMEFDNLIRYRKRRPLVGYYTAAAVVLIALIVWPVLRKYPAREHAVIRPGSARATLTVSNGTTFSLQSDSSQLIDMNGVARIDTTGKGIIYVDMYRGDSQPQRDILRTSRGGEYCVYLTDGSMVYLNADTELEYIVPFDVDKREVKLSGEAYFEIAKENNRPFSVIVDGVRIQVYGTTFTVNTRKRERIRTVLVEGSIGIHGTRSGEEFMMHPGQLSLFSHEGELLELKEVNTYPYVAWKDGKFIFEEEELEHIMETLSLWYDVDVVYQNNTVKHHLFTGHLKKYDDIGTILSAICQIIDVSFDISERVITVKDSR